MQVGNANPGRISSVGVANPGRISSVGNANPGRISSVGPDYGMQGYAPGGYSSRPLRIGPAGGGGASGGGNPGGGGFYRAAAAPPPDPFAERKAAFNRELPTALENIRGNARDAFGTAGRTLRGNAEGLVNKINTGQKGINRSRENVELNRLNGMQDIISFVRNGLQQGSTRLSNMNALESSAAGALGRAYNQIGNEKSRGVGNAAFLEGREIDTSQEQLDLERNQGDRDFDRIREEQVASIGGQIRQQLMALDQQARGIGLEGRIAIDQEKQRVIDEGLGQLNAVDAWLSQNLGGVKGLNGDQIRENAQKLRVAGTAGTNPFDTGLEDYLQQEVEGPAIAQLPLFTRQRRSER